MTTQKNSLQHLAAALDDAGITYMIAGSIGSSFHGQPRATNDTDIVIEASEKQLQQFIEALGNDYYVSVEAALEALKGCGMFNVIDMSSGWKIDLIIRKPRAYSKLEFSRRQKATVMGISVWIVTVEDCILSKLEWSINAGSERQFDDALGVAMAQYDRLDFDYLNNCADMLGVVEQLRDLLAQARQLKGG